MMKCQLAAAALGLLLFCSCGKSGRIDPDRLDFDPEFDESGYAIAYIEGNPVVIDRNYVAKTPVCSFLQYSGKYIMAKPADGSRTRLYDSKFTAVDSAVEYFSEVSDKGIIWLQDADSSIVARKLPECRDVFREPDAEVMQVTDAGTVLLRRCGAHEVQVENHGFMRPAYDYMIADADGVIKAPWGRYRYIDNFSYGLARFTNGAYYCRMRTGHFANDDFSDMSSYTTHKYGYIDENGQVAIPERYEMCDAFDEDGHARADVVFGDGQPNIIIDSEGNIVGRYRATRGGLY